MSVPQLPEGYKVRYRHTRHFKLGTGTMYHHDKLGALLPKGGKTEVFVFDADGNQVTSATALCHPKDAFNKKLGRQVALGRALKGLAGGYDAGPVRTATGRVLTEADFERLAREEERRG